MHRMQFLVRKCFFSFIYLVAVIGQEVREFCPPLKPDGVDVVCEFEGNVVSCETAINMPGTKAHLACKPSYKIPIGSDPGYRELTCLEEGVWDRFLFSCVPECGTVLAEGKPFIINGFTAKRGFPWHVGIYEKNCAGNYEQICAGTLVSPDLVISAAHCFYDDRSKKLANACRYAVAAGKHFRSFYTPEPFAKRSTVKEISITKGYLGLGGNYAEDISLIRLESPFTITTLVRPICVDWENEYERDQLQEKKSGKIMGWGKNAAGVFSEELQEINLPFVNYGKCISQVPEDFRNFITNDKFCAGYLNGSSLCDGDSGGGLTFQFEDRWYLRGIVSIGVVNRMGSCDRNFYTAFTNVGLFLDWIRDGYLNLGISDGGQYPQIAVTPSCILPEQPQNGSFVLGSCKGDCKIVPRTRVPLNSYLIYKCNEGYTISGNRLSFCDEAGWYSPPTCLETDSLIYCPELISKSVEFSCSYQGKAVSCKSEIAPGTKATLSCKNFYKMPSADPGFLEITCLETGEWDRTAFDCDPECGTVLPEGTRLIVNGTEVKYGKFPWILYLYVKNSGADFYFPKAAILLSPDLALAQADSLVEKDVDKVLDPKNLAVIAGQSSFYYNSTPEPYSQHSFVKRVEIFPGYTGVRRHHVNNLALLRLETPFEMTEIVRPICVDWDNRVTEEIFKREKLEEVLDFSNVSESHPLNVSFLSSKECKRQVIDLLKSVVRSETFCTSCVTDTSRCNDVDNHNGFGCQSEGVWYLLGYYRRSYQSQHKSCEWLRAFEKISPHLKWIRTFYNASSE